MKKLYDYQEVGATWLAGRRRAYLADDPGLGKTIQAAVAARQLGLALRNVLVICPAAAVENWKHEWRVWGPPGPYFNIISYDMARRADDTWRNLPRDLVILDEAHKCKTNDAQRTRVALDVARRANRAWLLSATPMPNHPGELYTVIRVLWPAIPARLGITRYWEWFNRFCAYATTQYGPQAFGAKNVEQLKPYLQQIMLRRTLDDIGMQLPPLRVDVSLLPRSSSFPVLAEVLDSDLIRTMKALEHEEAVDGGSAARLRRVLGEYKAPRIADILVEELKDQQYQKIVVMYHHHSVGMELAKRLSAVCPVAGFDGGASSAQRDREVRMFQDDPKCRVFLAQQTAAGIAINLQVASEIVLVEPDWSPDNNIQAIKRIHRIGSKLPCRARVFAVAGSLDEDIQRVGVRKIAMQVSMGLKSEKGVA